MSIRELREAVEAGTARNETFLNALGHISVGTTEVAFRAFHGSLDAAVALVEAVLPGWDWTIRNLPDADLKPPRELRHLGHAYADSTNSGYPARALLIATLKALEAQDA
jgi:hypothetical protein